MESKTSNTGIYFMFEKEKFKFLNYYEIYQYSEKILNGLKNFGLEEGEKIILQIEDQQKYICTLWACIMGRFIPVIVNAANIYTRQSEELNRLKQVCKQLPEAMMISTKDTWNRISDFVDDQPNSCVLLEDLMNINYQEKKNRENKSNEEELGILIYSSGSTGVPKGVLLTYQNICFSLEQTCEAATITIQDCLANWLPLTHVAGLIMLHFTGVRMNCNQIQIPPIIFSAYPEKYLEIISKFHVTVTILPNFALKYLTQKICITDISNFELSSLRIIWNGTEPVYYETIKRFEEKFLPFGLQKKAICTFYGMTEASCMITMQEKEEIKVYSADRDLYYNKQTISPCIVSKLIFVSSGVPAAGVEVKITDSNQNIIAENTIGDIWIKGKNIISYYYGQREKLAIDEKGFYQTGDIGFICEGQLYIVGRKKSVIILNGQNYCAEDIERVCESNQYGVKCIACGIEQDAKEELIIFVETENEQIFRNIKSYVKKQVSNAFGQRIKDIVSIEKFPYTESGKKQRHKLKLLYIQNRKKD